MNEFKGTPGPWILDEFNAVVHGEEPLHGWGRKETVRVSGVALPGRVTEEYAANTRLVSAAPELLEALTTTLDEIGHWLSKQKPDIKEKIDSAIAKALGESQ